MSKTAIEPAVRAAVAKEAKYRCGYCLTQTLISGFAMQIDHIIPEAADGSSYADNLWLACSTCNSHKAAKVSAIDPQSGEIVPLFNPRLHNWADHFHWTGDGVRVVGLTSTGRATVDALHMNNIHILKSRFLWAGAGWHPPQD